MHIDRKFPNTRLRRLRKNNNLIDLVSETNITSSDLIQPIFIKENFNVSSTNENTPWYLESNATFNTESPAWAVDRLSILALKIYHMRKETERKDVDQKHIKNCIKKLDVLNQQNKDLCTSIDELIIDIENGQKYVSDCLLTIVHDRRCILRFCHFNFARGCRIVST